MVSWRTLQMDGTAGFMTGAQKKRPYWERRKNAVYLQHVFALVHCMGHNARSIVDVGSHGCPYLEWFDWIPRKVSIDIHKPYRSPTVEGITADFLTFKPKKRFDICLCLQVLEHIPDARAFAQKLLASSPRVLISVPYLWAADSHIQHVHDPIDEAKVVAWFGQSPSLSMISTEHRTGVRRLICYFEELGWKRRLEKILSRYR